MIEPTIPAFSRRLVLTMAGGAALAPAAAAVPADLSGHWDQRGSLRTIGGVLHYAMSGPEKGHPLVLLPKLGGWIADWRFAAPYLATNRRVIAFDPPGHGGSRMDGAPPYIASVPTCAAMILGALDELGVDRFSIAGNSLGGIIGAVAAVNQPDRVDRLIVISSSLIGAMTREQLAGQDRLALDPRQPSSYAKDGSPLPSTPEQLQAFATLDPRVTREMALSRRKAGLWVRACERGVGRVGVTDYLPRIKAPTLLVYADRGRYARYAEVGLRLVPNAQAVTIRDSGSFVHQEKPAETAAAINQFLDRRT